MARANRKRSRRPQIGGGRRGNEEIGPPGHISRQEIVKALFPLGCDIAVIARGARLAPAGSLAAHPGGGRGKHRLLPSPLLPCQRGASGPVAHVGDRSECEVITLSAL